MSRTVPGYMGPYRLLNVVHTGRSSQIWQAYDDANQRMVGVKILLERFRGDREHIGYLRWESTVGQRLIHERIIRIYGFAWDRGDCYLTMEWFSAPNMKQKLRQGVDAIAHLIPKMIDQAAEGLGYLNCQGWVHRDVKPDNFLVNDEGEVKLIDLALVRRVRKGVAKWFTPRAKIQGTRSYMSPEQIRGEALDQRADVYSFGCMVYELVTGRLPYTAANAQDLLMKHLKASPPPPEAINRNVTPELSRLVRQALAKNPKDRPASAEEFLREFRTIRVFKTGPRASQTQ